MPTPIAPGHTLVRKLSIDVYKQADGTLIMDTYELFGSSANLARNVVHKEDSEAVSDSDIVNCLCEQIRTIYPIKDPI